MKGYSLILAAAVLVIAVSGCKKTYNCECADQEPEGIVNVHKIKAKKREQAAAECSAKSVLSPSTIPQKYSVYCELK